jgi:hypothetical protein
MRVLGRTGGIALLNAALLFDGQAGSSKLLA